MPYISVLVPTWKRPDTLERCLDALNAQTLRPKQVVVTVRSDDKATWELAKRLPTRAHSPVEFVSVEPGPLTAAMNVGLRRTTGEWVAMTDDDAEPRPDWLERLIAAFVDPSIGGVGGRDDQSHDTRRVSNVGTVSWFGRVVGNHHIGSGPPRDVELLKGVNCCFRGELLRRIGFDPRLHGRGNVSHWEMSLCFRIRREGWRLIYDPAITVEHHAVPRHDGDVNVRGGYERLSYRDGVHNETLALLEHLSPARCVAYLLWQFTVGTQATPGIVQAARVWATGKVTAALSFEKLRSAVAGIRAGTGTWRTHWLRNTKS